MKTMAVLIKEACQKLTGSAKGGPASGGKKAAKPSEEDMASFASGLLDEKKKDGILEYIAAQEDSDEAALASFLITPDISAETKPVPSYLTAKAKELMPETVYEDLLDAVVEFAEDVVKVIRTTGTILTAQLQPKVAGVSAFRGSEEKKSKVIEISKAVSNYLVAIKVTRIKKDLVDLIVNVKNRKTKKPCSGERISLVYGEREVRSSLTKMGSVEFDHIKLEDYKVKVIHGGESRPLASLSLKAL
ncbi:MAG: hypothetical protein V1883_00870 [Candidatus Omnitrophota bacterium]